MCLLGVYLRWQLQEGKTFYQKTVTETKQTMKVMNTDVVQTQKQTFCFSWTPQAHIGDTWVIKQKIEVAAMEIDIGNQKIKGGAGGPLADFLKALVDSEFTITLDTRHMKVTKMEGRDKFIKKLAKANPNMKPMLDQILSESALKQMAEPAFAAIPGTRIRRGGKWQRESDLDMGPVGRYTNVHNYTYEGRADGSALDKIKVETTLIYNEPLQGGQPGNDGLPFKIQSADLKGSAGTGTILYDREKGRVAKMDLKQDVSGKMTIEIGGQTTEITLKQSQATTTTISDAKLR